MSDKTYGLTDADRDALDAKRARDELIALRAEVASLRAALLKHGSHSETCHGRGPETCTCGFSRARAAALAGRGPDARGRCDHCGATENGQRICLGCSESLCKASATPSPDAPPTTHAAVQEQGARIPDVRGLLEAVDAVTEAWEFDEIGQVDGALIDALAAKRKEWP